jgi:mannose/fructose/N-acetylgalactosamine-specific phosphotransferase system component IID
MGYIIEKQLDCSKRVDRSIYHITVKQIVSQAMSIEVTNSDAILGMIIIASLTNSYVEGSAIFTCIIRTDGKESSERVAIS